MFDKITIRASLSDEECAYLAQLHRLQSWVNENKTQVEYRSSKYSNLTGVEVKIVRGKMTMKTSLHKYYNEKTYGKLRNDTLFSVSEAKLALDMLLEENRLNRSAVRITQFELGLNLPVSYDPLLFIERARAITYKDKLLFVDANYQMNRQKTTLKHRRMRKYYKIYDKTFEMKEKQRNVSDVLRGEEEPPVLRVETVYRRHNERADRFFSDANVERLVQRFFADWQQLFFFRSVRAYKGARKSEIERATKIVNDGAENYLQQAKADFEHGKITPKQFRTIREFVRDFNKKRKQFKTEISAQEIEYKKLLYSVFNDARK